MWHASFLRSTHLDHILPANRIRAPAQSARTGASSSAMQTFHNPGLGRSLVGDTLHGRLVANSKEEKILNKYKACVKEAIAPRSRPSAAVKLGKYTFCQGRLEESMLDPQTLITEMAWAQIPSLADLMLAVNGTRSALESKMDTVAVDISLICADMKKTVERVTIAKGTIREHSAMLKSLQAEFDLLWYSTNRLHRRAEDAEWMSCRNNMRLVGVPEKMEGTDIESYVEHFIREVVRPTGFTQHFAIERAHTLAGISLRL
ncbi:hypothetical protein NDU88_004132 [Pleurodeles waltl]|uniref:Uncharacterized protein n=1 Tax=Pleurodeles waltl TaxID=8319 RepID=A0AAV7T6L9_PLEWA|nr:hypothetical protein NDU88_004132 [Pleurodeles waltl]